MLLLVLAITTLALLVLGIVAIQFGADTRDGFQADARFGPAVDGFGPRIR